MNLKKDHKKICINCRGDWDICKGIECQCFDGSCCCEFNPKDIKSFWYEWVKKE